MSDKSTEVTSEQRFEFRTFGQGFAEQSFRMSRLSSPVHEKFWRRESTEIYIVSESCDTANVKIRDNQLDVKVLVQTHGKLQQWEPVVKYSFPVSNACLRTDVLDLLTTDVVIDSVGDSSLETLLSIIKINEGLQIVHVNKIRHGFMINGVICECAEVLINGARLTTLCVEAVHPDDVLRTLKEIGLDKEENISYPEALKRVIGMENKPIGISDDNWDTP